MQYEIQDLKNTFRVPSDFDPSDYKCERIKPVHGLTSLQWCCFICKESAKEKIQMIPIVTGNATLCDIIACSKLTCMLTAKVSKAIDEAEYKVLRAPKAMRAQCYNVKRSNGDVEDDWCIEHILLKEGVLTFGMKKKEPKITKWIPCEMVLELNHDSICKNMGKLSEQLEACFCEFYPIKEYEIYMGVIKKFEQMLIKP